MSLARIISRILDGQYDKDDRNYLELMYSDDFHGMNALNPITFFLTPGCGNWLPFKDYIISTECSIPLRVYGIFKYPPKLVDKQ